LLASLNQEAAFNFSARHAEDSPSRNAFSASRRPSVFATLLSDVFLDVFGCCRASVAFLQPSANARFPALPPLSSNGLKKTRDAGAACAANSSNSASPASACHSANFAPDFAFVLAF
jgi:hypothetical protein